MRRRKQKPSETFDSFLDSMMNISDKLRVPVSELEFVEIILRNLRAELRHELLHLNITDMATLGKEARKHDKFFEDISSHTSQRQRYGRTNITEVITETSNDVNGIDGDECSNEINEVSASNSSLKCWNCDIPGHRYQDCLAPRRIFCYGCGAIDTYRPSCLKCVSKPENFIADVRRSMSGHPPKRLVEKSLNL